jgi:hypothetical protein
MHEAVPGATGSAKEQFVKVADHIFNRKRATLYGTGVGVLIGIGNSFLALDFTLTPALFAWLVAAILIVLILHEGLHGGVGLLLGHRPVFGFEPPLVYTTYREKVPRGHLIAIALAPLLLLDSLFIVIYLFTPLKLFADLCFAVNTIGSVGDIWITLKISRHERGTFVQDTKTGVEVWSLKGSESV